MNNKTKTTKIIIHQFDGNNNRNDRDFFYTKYDIAI